jgi:uncharacterized membrane protein YsdA (DUF1294 family)
MTLPDVSPGTTGFLVLCLAGYLLVANLLAFTAFGLDKRRALNGDWRIPERKLLLLATLGGWVGAKLAQRLFRHKSRKQPFRILLNLSVLVLPALIATAWVLQSDLPVQQTLQEFAARLTSDTSQSSGSAVPRRFGPGS